MTGSTTEYLQPSYSSTTNAQLAGGIQGMLGNNGYLNDVMGNWYNQSPSQGALGQYAQYNPGTAQQFMNPYTSNVINANNQQSNQNLMENILPGVNSTFTGNGQFGSSRNNDFALRAIRDNQQTLNNTNSNVLMNAQNQANANYQNWTQMGINAGQQDYTNWLQQANYPIGALTQLSTAANNLESSTPLATVNNTSTTASSSNIDQLIAALTAANTAAGDGTFNWLSNLGS